MIFTLSENGSLISLVDQIYIELSLTQTWTCNVTNIKMRAFYIIEQNIPRRQYYHINLNSNSGVHFFYSSIRCMTHFYFGKVSIWLVVMN